jgi:hypothetical protein
MDSVGNWQLDMVDHEVAFPKDAVQPSDVDNFIRNASLYILTNGDVIKHGDTMDGAGDMRWHAGRFETSISEPPREVICWVPLGAKQIPSQVTKRALKTDGATAATSEPKPKRPWWKRW